MSTFDAARNNLLVEDFTESDAKHAPDVIVSCSYVYYADVRVDITQTIVDCWLSRVNE